MAETKEQSFLIRNVIANVVSFIAEDRGITVEQAVEVLFSCELSTKIEDVERGIIIIWRVFL